MRSFKDLASAVSLCESFEAPAPAPEPEPAEVEPVPEPVEARDMPEGWGISNPGLALDVTCNS